METIGTEERIQGLTTRPQNPSHQRGSSWMQAQLAKVPVGLNQWPTGTSGTIYRDNRNGSEQSSGDQRRAACVTQTRQQLAVGPAD